MCDYPNSLPEFQRMFPDEDACATWLFKLRWRDDFECPASGHKECCALKTRKWLYQCKICNESCTVLPRRSRSIPYRTKIEHGFTPSQL